MWWRVTLIGKKKTEIIQMLHNMGESETDYEIIDFDGEELESAKIAIKLVKEGKADIPMKGILQTSNFARAILEPRDRSGLPLVAAVW